MNKIYRSIWNNALGSWVAVSECSGGNSKSNSSKSKKITNLIILFGSALLINNSYAICYDGDKTINPLNGAVQADRETCEAKESYYYGNNTVAVIYNGKLTFLQPFVNVDSRNSTNDRAVSINGYAGGYGSQAYNSQLIANSMLISGSAQDGSLALEIYSDGKAIFNGDLTTILTEDYPDYVGYKSNGNIKLQKAATLSVMGDIKSGLYILGKSASTGPSFVMSIEDSTVSVNGNVELIAGQSFNQGVDDPQDYAPGGKYYDRTIGVLNGENHTLLNVTGNSNISMNSLDLKRYQNGNNSTFKINLNGKSSKTFIRNNFNSITYGDGNIGLLVSSSGIEGEKSTMAIGGAMLPVAEDNKFQLHIGGLAIFKGTGENNTAISLKLNGSAEYDVKIESGAIFDYRNSNGTGIFATHSGTGVFSIENAAEISTTAASINLSANGLGNSGIINTGILESMGATHAAVEVTGTSPLVGNLRTVSLNNSGSVVGALSAIRASGDAGTNISLVNSGNIGTFGNAAETVIDLAATAGHNTFTMQDGLLQASTEGALPLVYTGGSGVDELTQTGGRIQGIIQTNDGDDLFTGDAGELVGSLVMGKGDDHATIASSFDLTRTVRLDGEDNSSILIGAGVGKNSLTLDGQKARAYTADTDAEVLGVNLINWQNTYLKNDADLQLTGSLVTELDIDKTSRLTVGTSAPAAVAVDGGIVNAGTIDLRSSNFNVLTVVGDYVGSNGKLLINTYFGDSISPSDRMVIDAGNASGSTEITVGQKGGLGAQTTGNGIEVISVVNGGTTELTAFSLHGGSISAGAYTYSLARSAENEMWYLRSVAELELPAQTPAPVTTPEEPPQQNYSPQTSVMSAVPSLALLHGATLLDSWHDRMGANVYGVGNAKRDERSPGWVRVIAHAGSRDGGKRYQTGASDQAVTPDFDYNTYAVQLGSDFYRSSSESTRKALGAYIAWGETSGKVEHWSWGSERWIDAKKAQVDGKTIGVYGTSVGSKGQYLDAVLQYTDYDVKTSALDASSTKSGGKSWAASLEGGVPYALNNEWMLTPQAQLRWQHISLDDARAVESGQEIGRYRFSNTKSLWGRLGVQATYQNTRESKLWVRADLMREFKGDSSVQYMVNPNPVFQSSLKGTSVGLTGGMDYQISKLLSLYGSMSYVKGFSGNKGDAWTAKAGLRWNW